MMVKAGLGIGLLANYAMGEPAARAVDLGVHVKLRLYAVALTQRLEAKPVSLVFDLLAELFGPRNPWFNENLALSVENPAYREGHTVLFNL
jgi:DNA-binding transcriptional LysR family regulator